ncbi:MAG: AMP-binding protein [Thermodesulfobacteriota bacterium]
MTSPGNDRYLDRTRETRPWEDRLGDLDRKFQDTLDHVWRHSKAYQEIYRQAGLAPGDVAGLADLARLPVVRMADLLDRQKAQPPFGGFETVPPDRIRRIYVNPGLIWQPGDWEYVDTSWAEGLCGAGFQKGDRVLNTFNYHLWPFAFMLDESLRMIGATVVPTGAGNTLMQVKILQTLGINAFMGTPSFLNTLVQRAEGLGLDPRTDLCLEKAMVGAEMLPESLRARLEAKIGLTICQTYGTVFLGCLGYECPHKTGLHVPDNLIIEIVDPHTGGPVTPGAPGEIVATIFNRTHPLIRFATGDLSLLRRDSCACGRTGPMLAKVLGRVDQATKVHSTFVHPWQTDGVVARFPEVFKYMVVITREEETDQMTFWIELREEVAESGQLAARIERDIKEFLTVKGRVKVVPRGTIPDFHQKIEDRRSWE